MKPSLAAEEYLEPGSLAWRRRRQQLLAGEAAQPECWWYLSFAGDGDVWLGGCLVKARGFMTAIEKAEALHITPGKAQVRGWSLKDSAQIPRRVANRLLTMEELDSDPFFGGAVKAV